MLVDTMRAGGHMVSIGRWHALHRVEFEVEFSSEDGSILDPVSGAMIRFTSPSDPRSHTVYRSNIARRSRLDEHDETKGKNQVGMVEKVKVKVKVKGGSSCTGYKVGEPGCWRKNWVRVGTPVGSCLRSGGS